METVSFTRGGQILDYIFKCINKSDRINNDDQISLIKYGIYGPGHSLTMETAKTLSRDVFHDATEEIFGYLWEYINTVKKVQIDSANSIYVLLTDEIYTP